MFRKKKQTQTQIQIGRNVKPRQTANVFSYYASRSPAESQSRQPNAAEAKRNPSTSRRRWLAYTPSILAGLILVFCLVYVSTLDTNPKLQLVGEHGTDESISIEAYQNDVGEVFGESIANRSKLLINTDAVAKRLQERFPELGDIAVILPLVGRRPVVQVRPAEPALVLGTIDGGLVVDENGRTISDARDVESSVRDKLPVLQDESGLAIERGKYALPKETVDFVQAVAAQITRKNYKVQSLVLPPVANEMHLRIDGRSYYAKMDIRGDSRVQAGTFIATLEKLEADKVTPREYIDVRVPGKAYYK